MRIAAIQFLTWGTVAGAVGSALLLAMLELSASARSAGAATLVLPQEPTQAGRRPALRPAPTTAAASAPTVAVR